MQSLLQTPAALVVAFFCAAAAAQSPASSKESGELRLNASGAVVLVRADKSMVGLGCIPKPALLENLGRRVDIEGIASATSAPGLAAHLCVRRMAVPPQ